MTYWIGNSKEIEIAPLDARGWNNEIPTTYGYYFAICNEESGAGNEDEIIMIEIHEFTNHETCVVMGMDGTIGLQNFKLFLGPIPIPEIVK